MDGTESALRDSIFPRPAAGRVACSPDRRHRPPRLDDHGTNLKAVLRRALGRAGIVEGYGHRCRKPGCGNVEFATDDANRRCPNDNRALWIRPLPKKGIVFHSLRHTTATLLARAKVHPSVSQKILRHANIETTLAIYTHLDGIEDMRAAVAKLDFGPLAECAPAPVVRCEKMRPLLPICYRQPKTQKVKPLTVPLSRGRSGASKSRGDWI
ncbi:MAG: tyrosine-type recombinase/integrase [Myxococcales bacterium]|nr:tyrosine-type recombinase/integrase [Myxococcales bacterium]